jgi:biotin transport system substrate-specific component
MTSITSDRDSTLYGRLVGRASVVTSTALVVAGAGLVGIAAQVTVPLWPVPITGQTLAVLVVGAVLGSVRGALALTLYAVAGVVGVPWFSESSSGWSVVAGPTGGYVLGFIAAAALAGWTAERRWDRTPLRAVPALALASALPFAVGLPWLAVVLGLDLQQTLEAGLYPFLVGGVVKAIVAGAVLPILWRIVRRTDDRTGTTAPTEGGRA